MRRLKSVLFLVLSAVFTFVLANLISISNLRIAAITVLIAVGIAGFFAPLKWMLIFMFLYLGGEGFFKIVSGYNPLIHIGMDLLAAILLFKALATAISRREGSLTVMPPLFGLFVLHFVWFLITFFNPYSLGLYASLAGAKMYVTMVMLYFFGFYCTRSIKDVQHYMIPWIVVIAIQIVFSIYQGAHGPESVLSLHPGYEAPLLKFRGYAFRPFGLTALPGGPAIYIFVTIPFLAYFLTRARLNIYRFAIAGLILLAIITLFLCQIRSAILKSAFGMIGFFFLLWMDKIRSGRIQGQSRKAMLTLFASIASIPFLFEWLVSSYSDNVRAIERSLSAFDYQKIISARANLLTRFVDLVQQVPLGAGLSRTGAASGKFAQTISEGQFFTSGFFTDNYWLATLVDLGIPGMIILTLIPFTLLFRTYVSISRFHNQELKVAQMALFSGLAACVLGFYGAESILYNPEACFFWFFSGVASKLPLIDDELEDLTDFYAEEYEQLPELS